MTIFLLMVFLKEISIRKIPEMSHLKGIALNYKNMFEISQKKKNFNEKINKNSCKMQSFFEIIILEVYSIFWQQTALITIKQKSCAQVSAFQIWF